MPKIMFLRIEILILNLLIILSFSKAFPYPNAKVKGIKPRISQFNFDTNIVDGQTVALICQLIEGSKPISFLWLKDGKPLNDQQQFSSSTISSSSSNALLSESYLEIRTSQQYDFSSLTISRIDHRRDQGNYSCLVSNSHGTDQKSSILKVQEPPIFIEKPRDVSIGLKQSTFVICQATISTMKHIKPVIRWNRLLLDGSPIDKDARRELISSGEQFHLTDARIQDAGVYECVAENPHNSLTISHQFTVTINVPAHFKTKAEQLEVKRGDTAKLICEAFGTRPITAVWLRQNMHTGELETLDLNTITESFTFPRYTALEKNFDSHFDEHSITDNLLKQIPFVNNNRTLFELHINSVNSYDNGQYACRIQNDFGDDSRFIKLFVQDVPATVRNIELQKIWTNEVSFSWQTPESIGNSPITQYVIQYWKETRNVNSTIIASGYRLHEIELPSTTNICFLKNLTPGTSYVARVLAVNQFGRGPSSQQLRFETAEEVPSAAPIDIVAETQGTTSIRIRWKAPPKGHWNGQLKGYYLGYRLISTNEDQKQKSKQEYILKQVELTGRAEDNHQEEFLLTGLQRSSLYGIIVKCFNNVGESPNSHEVYASTASKDPPPKPILIFVEAKDNNLILKWNQKTSDDITHYILFFKEDSKRSITSQWMEREITKNTLTIDEYDPEFYIYRLGALHRGTNYQIYIRSVDDQGSISEKSDIVFGRTEGEMPLVSMLNQDSSIPQQPFHIAAAAAIPTIYSPTLSTYQQNSHQVPPYFRLGFILPVACAIVIIVIACVGAFVYIRIDDRNTQMKILNATSNAYMGTLAVGPGKRFQYLSPANSTTGTGTTNNNNKSLFTTMTPSNSTFNQNSTNQTNLRDSLSQSLVSEESSLSFRYSDSSSDKSRPLLGARPPILVPSGVVWAQQQTTIPEEDESAAIVDLDSSAYETLPFQKNQILQSTPLQSFTGQTNQQQQQSILSVTAKSPPFPPPPPPLPGVFNTKPSPLNKPGVNNVFCHSADVHHAQSSVASSSDANNSDSYDDFHFFSPARV